MRPGCVRARDGDFSGLNAKSANESWYECPETEAGGEAKGSVVCMYNSVGVIGDSGLYTRLLLSPSLKAELRAGLKKRSL